MGLKDSTCVLRRRKHWIDTLQCASPLPFSDRLQEERYEVQRNSAMASTQVAWGLFGALACLVTQQRKINHLGEVMIICASVRFLALSWCASAPPDRRWCRLISALQLTEAPLRSLIFIAFLSPSLNGLSDFENEKFLNIGPAIAAWNCLLFLCLEQMRLIDSCLLHAITILPVSVFISRHFTGSVLASLLLSLLFTAVPVSITAVLESANRAKFLNLGEGSSYHAAVHTSTICPEASAGRSEDESPPSALPETSLPETTLIETTLPETSLPEASSFTGSDRAMGNDDRPPWFDKDFDDVSDEEFFAWRDKIFSEQFKGLWLPITSVFLTIPDGDPSDLPEDAEKRLVEGFESSHPGMRVVSVTIKQGSLLVNIQIVSLQHSMGVVEDAASCLPSWQWLKWMDQPALKELSVQVEPFSGACATFLDNVPVVMSLPQTLPGALCPAFSVEVKGIPTGFVLRASFQGKPMALSLDGGEAGSRQDSSQEACLSVAVPTAAGGSLELPGLVSLEARCATTKQVVGVAPILLLPSGNVEMAAELSSRRRTVGACGEPDARALVGSLGWWIALIRSDDYKTGNVSERERQLARTAGSRLFWLLITQGRVASARWLLDLLLSSGTFARLQDLNTSPDHPQKRSLMHSAALSCNRKMVEEVLLWCTTHELQLEWTAVDGRGQTPLHLLAMNDEAIVLPWLLQSYPNALNAWKNAVGGMAITPARLARNVSRRIAPTVGSARTRIVVASAAAVRRVEMRAIANNTLVSAANEKAYGPVPEVQASGSLPAPSHASVSSADQGMISTMDLLRAGWWGFIDPIQEAQYVVFKATKLSNSVVLYCHCCVWVGVAFLLKIWAPSLLSTSIPFNAIVSILLRVAIISVVKNKNHEWAAKLYVMAWLANINGLLTTPFNGPSVVILAAVRCVCEATLFQVHSPLAVLANATMAMSLTWAAGTVYGYSMGTVAWTSVVHISSLLVRTVVDCSCRQAFLVTLGVPGATRHLKEE